jgi:hypothetical protein
VAHPYLRCVESGNPPSLIPAGIQSLTSFLKRNGKCMPERWFIIFWHR